MKVLTFGTCRTQMLWEHNDTFIVPINVLNLGSCGGTNVLSLSHDTYQTGFFLNLIRNKQTIHSQNNEYHLLSKMIVYLQNIGDYRQNLLQSIPDWDINVTIENIYNQLNDIDYIIVEVCTLKKLVIDGVPMFLDINDASIFNAVSDDEFVADFDNLVNLVKDINPNIKILFVSHIVKYKEMVIPEREKILNLLNKCSEKYNNCHVLSPSDYITDDDLEDNRHYNTEGYNKIRNAIADKIIDIESTNIVDKMNHSGILNFKLYKYLNKHETMSLENINHVLNNMIVNIKNNQIDKSAYNDNLYMYTINNYLKEPVNLNNPIFIELFTVSLSKIITKITEKYLNSTNIYINNTLAAVNYHYNDDRVQSQNWHRDPGGTRLLKCFIFFDQANKVNGTLEYIHNSQYTSLSSVTTIYQSTPKGDSIYPNIHDIEFNNLATTHRHISISEKNSCTLVDTSGFHRAGICENNNYRKYLHILFLTKDNVENNKNTGDRYELGFNHNDIFNINYSDLPTKWRKYFYGV